jgi:hypothetical protein
LEGRQPIDSAVKTPFEPSPTKPMPARTLSRPVIIEAREGLHTWNALYQLVNATPSAANLSRLGVAMVPLSPAKPERSLTALGWL